MPSAWKSTFAAGALAPLIPLILAPTGAGARDDSLVRRTLDGSRNNLDHPAWGMAGAQYRRVAPAHYADGRARPVTPAAPDRYVSNRIFNDTSQNLFSENGVSQWGFAWGQFLDHTFSLRAEGGEPERLPFSAGDPMHTALAPKRSFTAITGEAAESFPRDPEINPAKPIDDPDILDFVELRDLNGRVIPLGSEAADTDAVVGVRRTTTAARLKAIYGSVSNLDGFTGMLAEAHLPGTEFGELQRAIWKREFESLRDGDRFFHLNDPALLLIRAAFGIDFRRSLARVIRDNTGAQVADDVFKAPAE